MQSKLSEMKLSVGTPINEAGRLCGVLKAIGHPERLAILRFLVKKGCKTTVKDVYQSLNLEQPVVSRQSEKKRELFAEF